MAERQTRHNGLAIRWFRIKATGLKPGPFATKAGIAYSTLDNIENERKEASVEALHRIADALGVPVEAILRVDLVGSREQRPSRGGQAA